VKILSRSEEIQELFDRIKHNEYHGVYIYGARNAARRFYLEIQYMECSDRVKGFLVSSLANNPARIEDKKVYAVTDDKLDKGAIVIVTAEKKHLVAIEESLICKGFGDVYYPDEEGLLAIYKASSSQMTERLTNDKYVLQNNEADETYMKLSLKECRNQYYMVSPLFGTPYDMATSKLLGSYNFEKEYYEIFGDYLKVSDIEHSGPKEDTEQIKIYMVTSHMNQAKWNKMQAKHLVPIQAGAALTADKHCEVMDNTGDNISERNQTLGEMTATYWVWKNSPSSEYKGICHYRRHFMITESEYQAVMASKMDVVMCVPRFVLPSNVDNLIRMNLVDEDAVETLLRLVKKHAPEYYECTKEHFKHNMFYPCNMVIAKEKVFNEYCEFLFPIIFELDDYINQNGLKSKARCVAYLAELLTSVYFVYHKDRLNIAVADYQLVE